MNEILYLDHQGTTPTENRVISAMSLYWNENFGNPHASQHFKGWQSQAVINDALHKIGGFIGAEYGEVIFTSGATESNNIAIFSLCSLKERFSERSRILVSPIEHKCVLNSVTFWAPKFGLEIEYLKLSQEGLIDLDYLSSTISDDVLFCTVGAVNNEIGAIQNLDEISRRLRSKGIFFHSDLAQAPKTIDCIKSSELVDVASFSGHKVGGPPGIGCLFISASLQQTFTPLIQGGGQQAGLRGGTLPLPLCVGLGEAFSILGEPDALANRQKTKTLRDYLNKQLQKLSCPIVLNGPPLADRHVGNLNVAFEGYNANDLLLSLQPDLCASTGSACGSGNIEPSHVLSAIGLESSRADASLRFSLSHTNSCEEINLAVDLIASKL
jgi:cysteine desulfurase